MRIPTRLLLPLAGLGLAGFIVVGLLAAQQARNAARPPEIREQTVSVPAEDGTPLSVLLVEPSDSRERPTAVLVGIPTDDGRSDLARALARRGWAVAVLDLRGTGNSRVPAANAPTALSPTDPEPWVKDLAEVSRWVHALPHAAGSKPALVSVHAAAAASLAAKGGGEEFGALALVLPFVAAQSTPTGAPAYRTTPTGVLVVTAPPFALTAEVSGFLKEPTRTVSASAPATLAVAQDAGLVERIDGWLRNPGDAA